MWASVVMALISICSVMIIMRPLGMALIFVLNRLYLVVMALLSFFFTYFSFQIKNFLWEHYLKHSVQSFVESLLVKTKLKAPTTAATLPSGQLMSATPIESGREVFESRIQEAHNSLRDDSKGALGIWGMGGVGKTSTTLLEHISNTLRKIPPSFGFKKMVLLTASSGQTTGIFNFLKDKNFAILLDDRWEDLELKEAGIRLRRGMVGDHKFIVTSRFEKVCFNSLKVLDMSGCRFLKCFPTEICGLTKLEYLNISSTRIRSLPGELKALVNMKYLIARRTSYIDHRVPPELLSNLVNLIELDLFWSGNTEDFASSVIDNLHCLEGRLKGLGITVTTVSNLQKLVQLSGIPIRSLCMKVMESLDSSLKLLSRDFLGSQHIRSNLNELTLCHCESVMEVVVERSHQLNIERLDLLWATGLKEIKWKGVEPRDVLSKLRELAVNGCHALKSIEWVMYLPCLETLDVRNCLEMKQMFGKEGGAAGTNQEEEDRPTFPSLGTLALRNIPKLRRICHRPLTFPSLEVLCIFHCEKLKKLPFHSPSSCTKLGEIRCDEATWKGIVLEDNMQATLMPLLKIELTTMQRGFYPRFIIVHGGGPRGYCSGGR